MALYIGTNSASLSAQRSLITSQSNLQTSFERLSSGSRINSAADDAAGMAIASRLQAQASGLEVAQRNAANGISLVETADAALGTMVDLLTRARDLTLQYSDGTLSASDKSAIEAEVYDIGVELERIRTKTTFAGVDLLNGLQTNPGGTIDEIGLGGTGATGVAIGVDASGTQVAVALETAFDNLRFGVEVTRASSQSDGAISDIEYGANYISLTAQGQYATDDDFVGLDQWGGDVSYTSAGTFTTGAGVTTVADLDALISTVNSQRAQFGALANTFQSAIENLAAMEQGVTSAAGRIMDADFARESAELAKNQILQQAGTSVLAQANQSTQSVLSLLQ